MYWTVERTTPKKKTQNKASIARNDKKMSQPPLHLNKNLYLTL